MLTNSIPKVEFAIIGGSGTWDCEFPEDIGIPGVSVLESEMEFETPYGRTVAFKHCKLDGSLTSDGHERTFLTVPFHGFHGLAPHNNPSEQIFWVFKEAGVKFILAEGSGGSINPLAEPGDIIIPHDFIDMTKRRSHIAEFTNKIIRVKDPLCPDLRSSLYHNASGEYRRVFRRGVYATTEAPRFETASEIQMLRDARADITGHTMVPEVYLARAIGACYAGLYIVSNFAEGMVSEWEGDTIFDWYSECALPIGRIMLKTLANIVTDRKCACMSYRTEVPTKINKRIHAD
jgi:5'-methylthioadenosine phosphorylase